MVTGPDAYSGNVVTIAVMGATGTGKSTFVNLLSGSCFEVGVGLLSCTPAVQVSNDFNVAGRRVRLIDTPGFDDTFKTDREILQMISSFLADQYRQDLKVSGVLYMHRISDFKMSGISRRNFGMFRSLCGEKTLKNVVIVTNMWGEVPETLGATREHELRTDGQLFKPVLDSGANMMRHHGTLESAQQIIQTLLDNHPIALQIQAEIVDEHKNVEQTQAGAELESEALAEQKRKQEEALLKTREAAEVALRAQQEAQALEIERLRKEKEDKEARARAAHERALAAQEEARRREEERLQAVQRELEAQAAARRKEEERVLLLEEQRLREAREHEEARRRHEAEMERLRHNNNDCRIF